MRCRVKLVILSTALPLCRKRYVIMVGGTGHLGICRTDFGFDDFPRSDLPAQYSSYARDFGNLDLDCLFIIYPRFEP